MLRATAVILLEGAFVATGTRKLNEPLLILVVRPLRSMRPEPAGCKLKRSNGSPNMLGGGHSSVDDVSARVQSCSICSAKDGM